MDYAPFGKKGRIWPSRAEFYAERDYIVGKCRDAGLSADDTSRMLEECLQAQPRTKDIKPWLGKPCWTKSYPEKAGPPRAEKGIRRPRRI